MPINPPPFDNIGPQAYDSDKIAATILWNSRFSDTH
jgi:hypothetical protein